MRSAVLFAILAILVISAQAWSPPSWKQIEDSARKQMEEAKKHLESLKKHLPVSVQNTLQQAMKKMEDRNVQTDIHNAMKKMHSDLMSRWRNMMATEGLHVRNSHAMEVLMRHMVLAQARHNMEKSTLIEKYAHHVASQLLGGGKTAGEIQNLARALSTLGHNYMRKVWEGAESIMHKNGVTLNKEQLSKALHQASIEVMNGKSVMDALLTELKKMNVNTDMLDNVLKNQLNDHFEKMKAEGLRELEKVMKTHQVPHNIQHIIMALRAKGKEMMEKLKAMQTASPKGMEELTKKAFKHMQPQVHHKMMVRLHLIIRPAMYNHYKAIMGIYKKHNMGVSHTLVHYTIYHRMRKEMDDNHRRHHHHWWHSKPARLGVIIGGSLLGVVLLVALVIVAVHMLKDKRRAPKKNKAIDGEKCGLPYSVMEDEKNVAEA